ncbi:Flagellar basal body rod protein FlgB [Caprobacter fermentans]|uniref:Flagellar basal body rod protein FlgB n=1 Tax=Caproicibacter fermentans TaxID=2576756 RepID=A0A6N8HVY9_9FIRM|nr:flagellar basal body rod protein FlgB [Caproicibacter fermentans]MVB09730.1 Flagellar basal body rod protein FlgB [Caproicibacter fermentans]OCN03138.1 flagellar basal-body rod protein FlgB [Clostridium sp. W14A]
MNWSDSVTTSLLKKDLDGLWARQQAVSDNIANFETPGYKTKSVSFEDQLQNEIAVGGTSDDMVSGIDQVQPETTVAQDEMFRADGNGVDLEQQNVESLRTQMNYYYSLQTIGDVFSRLKTAIGGGT